MKQLFIGAKFFGHDSAVFYICPKSNRIFGITTERLTRYKHDDLIPVDPLKRFVSYMNINPLDVEEIFIANSFTTQKNEMLHPQFYELSLAERNYYKAPYIGEFIKKRYTRGIWKKLMSYGKLLINPDGRKAISLRFPREKADLDSIIIRHVKDIFPNASVTTNYYDHEFCHAISSYVYSGFKEALMITMDGHGDNNVYSSVYLIKNDRMEPIVHSASPLRRSFDFQGYREECSIGGLYSYFTFLLGFKPDSDEGKVEALAAYGSCLDDIYKILMSSVVFLDSGAIQIDQMAIERDLNYNKMVNFLRKHKREDVAATIQHFLEKIVLAFIRGMVQRTGVTNLCLSGGVFANVILNLRIFEEISKNIFIVPAMADDGSAQGAAIQQLLDNGVSMQDLTYLREGIMPYFGTSYSKIDVMARLKKLENIKVRDLGESWPDTAAEFLSKGRIGAIFFGRMEWGPRALGNRSILADARMPDVQNRLNTNIKNRPAFQPFCPSMLIEEMDRLFENVYPNPHMTCAFRMKNEFWKKIPGAIHIDGTSRVQFVKSQDNPGFYRLLKKMRELTGFGVLLNTSFNKHGRTIVESPEDAVTDFLDSNLDFLVIEEYLVERA